MRISNYIRNNILKASQKAFGECQLILFGSRIDDNKKGGDFDIAIKSNMDVNKFRKAKVIFFKTLILKDLDLPIDLVLYHKVSDLLKQEINKGEKL
jgi:predicted nucleotidyltransferase